MVEARSVNVKKTTTTTTTSNELDVQNEGEKHTHILYKYPVIYAVASPIHGLLSILTDSIWSFLPEMYDDTGRGSSKVLTFYYAGNLIKAF